MAQLKKAKYNYQHKYLANDEIQLIIDAQQAQDLAKKWALISKQKKAQVIEVLDSHNIDKVKYQNPKKEMTCILQRKISTSKRFDKELFCQKFDKKTYDDFRVKEITSIALEFVTDK